MQNRPDAYGIHPPGFRLPDATRVGQVVLQVSNLRRSLEYYTGVIGLRVLDEGSATAHLGAAEGAGLVELREHPGASAVPPRGRLGLYHFAILLPDRAALGAFARHLAEIGEYAGASDHLVSEALYLRDPDGLGIEVYADRPRERWRTRDSELVMATQPLDTNDLVAAARDRPWSGAPGDTVIGHLHLHVGDLGRAAAFYHEALGLDKTVWSYPGALFLSAGGYHHHLGLNVWAAGASPAGEADARLLEWELLVPREEEVRGALGSLAAAGFAAVAAPDGGLVRDPWGTAVRLRTRPG